MVSPCGDNGDPYNRADDLAREPSHPPHPLRGGGGARDAHGQNGLSRRASSSSCARALNEMDVPTRQSYVMAVVKPGERLAMAGVTSLVKLSYDALLWREFRRVRPPEEIAGSPR